MDISQCSNVTSLTTKYVGWGLVVADFDDDGLNDLFQANGHVYPKGPAHPYAQPPLFLRNLGNEHFEDVTTTWARCAAVESHPSPLAPAFCGEQHRPAAV